MSESGSIRFVFGGRVEEVSNFDPQLTVLDWLRLRASRTGTKEGCAEGDCGACTVVLGELDGINAGISYRAVNACIQLLATLDGRQLITVEDLAGADGSLHPVQQALVDRHGSQCGFCTPGFVMSLFALYHQPGSFDGSAADRLRIEESLAGNLCRCTGYAPILNAAADALAGPRQDRFKADEARVSTLLTEIRPDRCLHLAHDGRQYHAPLKVEELCTLLSEKPGAVMFAGATDVGLWITKQQRQIDTLVHVGRVAELQGIRVDWAGGLLEIGAAVTYSDAMDSLAGHYPELRPLLGRIGALQVRNAGTIGGNIANGSPIGDMAPPLFVLGARLVLRSQQGSRTIGIEDFYIEYGRQDLQTGECLEKILLPLPAPGQLFRVYKLSKRFEQDISAVCAAFLLELDGGVVRDARICYGGMAGVPKRAVGTEQSLLGLEWDADAAERAAEVLERDFEPISDWRASAGYRMRAARNLLRRFWLETAGGPACSLDGGGPGGRKMPAPPPTEPVQQAGRSCVHSAIAHDSAVKHVTGKAIYVDDIREPAGLLHVYFGTSEVAHGRIRSMDLSQVQAAPGVFAVLTAEDIPGFNDLSPMHTRDEEILCSSEIQCHGQVLFAVAAEDRESARRAARLAVVDVEELPAILDIETALEQQSWVAEPREMGRGDAPAAIAAATHRLSGEIRTGGQEHFYLEGHAALAIPLEDGDMLIHASSQNPAEVQHLTAQALGRANNAVTVEVRRMGGAFGGKETQAAQWAVIAALVADRTGRPAKIRLDRDEDMISTGKRHDFRIRYEVGFDDDGRIEGVAMDLAARCGIAADLSAPICDRAMFHADNGYYLPNVHLRSWRCRTHTVSNTALRGFGGPQGMMAIERVIDAIAARLGKDPLDVRRVNLYGTSERNVTPYGMTIEDNVLPELMDELVRRSDYQGRRDAIGSFNRGSQVIKRGIALTPVKFGISFTTDFLNQAGAIVHVYKDGSIHLNHGGTEMGQGLFTKVAQVVADAFGVAIDRVKITATHTGKVPNTSPTAASSGSDMNAMAALDAVERIKRRLVEFAAEKHGVNTESVQFGQGRVLVGEIEKTFPELVMEAYLARISLSSTGYYRTPKIHFDWETASGRPFYYFVYGAAVTEVEVDTLTGEHRMRRVDILHDTGRSLNPAIDLGQIEGGFVQGAGWLTSEELWWDESGALRTHSPSTYKIPTSGDLPEVFKVEIWEKGCNREPSIYRSKAVGEPPLMLAISVHSAICQAIANAVPGQELPQLDAPATPERVLMSIQGEKQ
ncbi:MAG: xanthine dehydrogenase molybdopterin binding subunit [Xanthomonadales bacterium]|nr:xanthine dehydrogenase molybdopterin binding subunit [Xanthomonadales bacterium]